jgi:photosystem II stability/assembly factor-like uncharacterized protein
MPVPIGPFGGSAAFVQVDPQQPETVLAATDNALLFRSTNGGESWTGLSFPASLRATLHALVVSPNTGVYLVGLSHDSRAYSGVFRSSDQGRTWSRMTALGSRDVWSVAVFQIDSRVIAAGTAEGVFLTRDGGEHWSRISPESNHVLRPVVSLAFDPLDWRMIYAGTPHLPWRTVNGGASWKPASSGMQDDSDVFSIQVAEPLRHVFASACSGIYRSLDRGDRRTKLRGADCVLSHIPGRAAPGPAKRHVRGDGSRAGEIDGQRNELEAPFLRDHALDRVRPQAGTANLRRNGCRPVPER